MGVTMKFLRQSLVSILCLALLLSTTASVAMPQAASQGNPDDANLTAQELDNLVSPIALYPDALVAQILAGSTYPDQITDANNWLRQHPGLKDQALMQEVEKQNWDPSVKALTQFPSVLANLAGNLSWTSALGEASYYQQQDVSAAIQRLRQQAKAAGNLKSGQQITVVQQDPQTIVIQPANPQVVYVPQYNPTVVYGIPYSPPGYSTADLVATGLISFGLGLAVGAAINNSCCGWGWGYGGWGMGWHGGTVVYHRTVWVSSSPIYRGGYRPGYPGYRPPPPPPPHGPGYRPPPQPGYPGYRPPPSGGNPGNRPPGNYPTQLPANNNPGNRPPSNGTAPPPNNGQRPPANTSNRQAWRNSGGQTGNNARPAPSTADRGYGQRPPQNANSGAFTGVNKGGSARAESSRGQTSMNGGTKQVQSRPPASAPAARPAGGVRQSSGAKK
jgi:Protein of unknown function (DUF3300)